MSATALDELADVLDRVKKWPAAERFALVRGVLDTLAPAAPDRGPTGGVPAAGTRGVPVEAVVGLLATDDREPPDDEECRRIVEEERWEKFGR